MRVGAWGLRVVSGAVMCCGLAGLVCSTLPPALAQVQTVQRVIQGKVVDKGDAPLKGAVVYLKDGHTNSVKTYIAGDDGSYRFGQLAQNTDYSLWAESGGKRSGTKSISSFDTKNDFNFSLKIDLSK